MPNLCNELHFGRPQRILFREIDVCFKETSLTAKFWNLKIILQSIWTIKKFTKECRVVQWARLPIYKCHCHQWVQQRNPQQGFCLALLNDEIRNKWILKHKNLDTKFNKVKYITNKKAVIQRHWMCDTVKTNKKYNDKHTPS